MVWVHNQVEVWSRVHIHTQVRDRRNLLKLILVYVGDKGFSSSSLLWPSFQIGHHKEQRGECMEILSFAFWERVHQG